MKTESRMATSYYQLCLLGINWSPQYFLDVLSEEGQHNFQGFADIKNQTKQEFYINRTELISGEAVLGIASNTRYGRRRSLCLSDTSLCDDEEEEYVASRNMPAIDSLPELAGKYHT